MAQHGHDPRLLPRLPGTPPPRLLTPKRGPAEALSALKSQAQRGIFGVQPGDAEQQDERPTNLLDRLFGSEGGVSRKQGLLAFGTSLLKAGAPRRKGTGSLGADLGAAIEAGQAGAAAGAQQEAQQKKQALRQKVMESFSNSDMSDPRVLQELFSVMLVSGDYEGAKSAAEVLKTMQGGEGSFRIQSGINPKTGEPAFFRIGATGQPELLETAQPKPSERPKTLKVVVGPGGVAEYAQFNPNTGAFERTGVQAPSQPGESERRAEFFTQFLPFAEQAFSPYDNKAPGRIGTIAQELGVREITSPEIQALHQGGNMYSEAWLRMTTGAAYNDTEFTNSFRMFVPMPGDKPGTLQRKKQARTMLRQALNGARGRAAYSSGGMNPADILGASLYNTLKNETKDTTDGRRRLR